MALTKSSTVTVGNAHNPDGQRRSTTENRDNNRYMKCTCGACALGLAFAATAPGVVVPSECGVRVGVAVSTGGVAGGAGTLAIGVPLNAPLEGAGLADGVVAIVVVDAITPEAVSAGDAAACRAKPSFGDAA